MSDQISEEDSFVQCAVYEDSKGSKKFGVDEAAQWFLVRRKFITIKETDMLLYFDGVKWSDGAETMIKEFTERAVHKYITRHSVSEIVEHIKRSRYIGMAEWPQMNGYINLLNGIYDVETGELETHYYDAYFRYVLPIEYKKDAKCPRFLQFLYDIAQGDAVLIVGILEAMAYTLMSGYPIQKAIMCVGSGANGKSTLFGVLRALLGSENVAHVTIQSLVSNRFALEWLNGKLANIAPDLPAKGLMDTGAFKAVTGGDSMDAEIKRVQRPVKIDSYAKQFFSANQIPESPDDSDAFYRRWVILEFKAVFKEGRNILPELTTPEELSGIFNLLVENFLPVLQKNLHFTFTQTFENTRTVYLKRSNTVKAFVEDCMSYAPDASMPKTELYDAYCAYCEAWDLIKQNEIGFWRKLKKEVVFEERRPEFGMPVWIYGQKVKILEKENNIPNRDNRDFPYTELLLQEYSSIGKKVVFPVQYITDWGLGPKTILDSKTILESWVWVADPSGYSGGSFSLRPQDAQKPLFFPTLPSNRLFICIPGLHSAVANPGANGAISAQNPGQDKREILSKTIAVIRASFLQESARNGITASNDAALADYMHEWASKEFTAEQYEIAISHLKLWGDLYMNGGSVWRCKHGGNT